ncbi:MAG: 5'-nucleotidase C-terminal domain-containing protein, partial [Chitinophagaceae bacterium]
EAYPGTDMAFTNSGALRQDISAGEVTVGNLISAFPFPNTVVICELKGEAILKLLEHGAGLTNGILQMSKGTKLIYDESKPIGQRIIEFTYNGRPLNKLQTYKVATSNFVADGGDGFLEFKKAENQQRTGEEIIQAMAKYLRKRGFYQPSIEGRIIVKGKNKW